MSCKVRQYTEADLEALKQMHTAQGFDYPFPDLADQIFLSKLVVEDEAGRPVMASLVRLTCEVYLLVDPRAGTSPAGSPRDKPRERWQRLLALHTAAERDAYARGLQDAHCWLPPQVARSFGRRLLRLGWKQPLWTCFAKELRFDTAPHHKEAPHGTRTSASR